MQKEYDTLCKTHSVEHLAIEIQELHNIILEKNMDLDRYTKDYNDLSKQTDELMVENRVLREMANLPKNYGINLAEIKVAQKIEVEE
jgi:hypothetical protein